MPRLKQPTLAKFSATHLRMNCMNVASFVTTPTLPCSHLSSSDRKNSYVFNTLLNGCIYPRHVRVRSFLKFACHQKKTCSVLCGSKSFPCRKDWTSGNLPLEEPFCNSYFISYYPNSSPSSDSATFRSLSSKVILNEKDSPASMESKSGQDSSSSSSKNNNDNVRNRKVPRAVAKARAKGEPVTFVEGKWVCMDCGYVYPDDASVAFEDLPDSWRCPICASPKRRFFKKQGNKVVARMSDDRWMIAIAIGFSLALVWFGYWAIHYL